MIKNNIRVRSVDCTTKLSDIEVTPNEITLKIFTFLDDYQTINPFEVSLSKEDLTILLEEIKKESMPELEPQVWYNSVRSTTAINYMLASEDYILLTKVGETIRASHEISKASLEKLIKEDRGSWILMPNNLRAFDSNFDYTDFSDDDIINCTAGCKVKELRDYCYGNGVMVSYINIDEVDPSSRCFEYRPWKKENIHIHSEEDADRFLGVTAIFGVPLFEDSNESDLEEEAQ